MWWCCKNNYSGPIKAILVCRKVPSHQCLKSCIKRLISLASGLKWIRTCLIRPLTNLYCYYAMMKLAKVNSITFWCHTCHILVLITVLADRWLQFVDFHETSVTCMVIVLEMFLQWSGPSSQNSCDISLQVKSHFHKLSPTSHFSK